ncbi:hypothetical protein Tco_0589944 [Tanacetum coccineum]
MNPQETQQVIARDEKWVPSVEMVKISSTNVFTISADILEIFMQQFWYTIKKVKDLESYEFLLANKKCIVDAEVFRKILDMWPRVKGEEFTKVQDDDATLTFLIDLSYKGLLHKYTNMYVDHMHQQWRTLAAIINKCLSRKTASNDRLRKSRINIMWGMFYIENVDYPELIWEDFAFQIDHIKERKSRRETMPFPLPNSPKLKFARIGEDYQEYGIPIPDMMLNDQIKQSESYQMFIKYSTGQIPPKKSRGKESDPKPARKRTASRRVVKKKVIISAADNIIPDPYVALELGKFISLTEAAKEEAARQVHATHARIVTESEPAKKKTGSRSTRGVVIQDTPSAPKPKLATSKLKLKGVQSLTPEEKEAADIMQALKESKKTSKRQPGTGCSNKGTGVSPRVPDESTVVPATSSEGTDQGDDEEVDWIDSDEDEEKRDDTDDDKSINLEMTDDEETDDEFVHSVEQVNDDEEEEMTNAEVEESRKGFGDQFLKISSDTSLVGTVKDTTNAEINSLLDIKIQSKVPHIQSPFVLTIHVLVIFEPVALTPITETPLVAPSTTLLPPLSVSTIPHVPHQTTSPIPTPPITTDAPTITTDVLESDALFAVKLRVAKLEKDVSELKKIDHSAEALATLKSQVPTIVEHYLRSKIDDDLQKKPTIDLEQEYEKSASEIRKIKREQAEKQKMPKNPANHTLYHALMEALIEDENVMDKGVSDTVKNHKREHDDDDDDNDDDEDPSAGPNQGKKTKRRGTKESKSFKKTSTTKETSKGKASTKSFKTGKSASTKEPVKKPIAEVVMDDAVHTAGEDVVRDDDQPQDTSKPKTNKTLNQDWFKQPPRPPTPDLDWNKRQVVLDQPEQPWFN